VVVINRVDELSAAERDELAGLVAAQFPGVPVLRMSAKTGEGFAGLTAFLDQKGNFGGRILDIDYDVYAEGEAELGWLNSSLAVKAGEAFDLDEFLLDVVRRLHASLGKHGAEVAHLKTIGLTDGTFGVANLVSSKTGPELSLPARARVREVDVIVNARVAIDPTILEEEVRQVVAEVGASLRAEVKAGKTQSFRPGRPQPTHRYAVAK
jgi:hypothetical protein